MKKLIFLTFLTLNANAVILENVKDLNSLLKNKKIAYYIGSFDPIHRGHESVVEKILEEKLADFVIVYPAWGGDKYKDRTAVNIRLDMLFALFGDSKNVIVTRSTPKELQDLLMVEDAVVTDKDKQEMKSAIEGAKYIGVIGADVALSLVENTEESKKKLSVFMRGVKVPEKYQESTVGGIMALRAESFIVALRDGSDLKALGDHIKDRKILSCMSVDCSDVSSTIVRNNIKDIEYLKKYLSDRVLGIILKHKLYN